MQILGYTGLEVLRHRFLQVNHKEDNIMQEGQEGFDKVTRHLLTQGRWAQDDDGDCMYLNEWGLRCAIGCLIPEGIYKPHMEHMTPCGLVADGIVDPLGMTVKMLNKLQQIHDRFEPKTWRRKLRYFATQNGFTFNTPPRQCDV
jgi:hypothetical protein